MKDYLIREYNPKTDREDLFNVWLDNHLELVNTNSDKEEYKNIFFDSLKYVNGSFQVFVALHKSSIVGYQSALPMRNNPATWREHALSSTYVLKTHQRSGIGFDLLKRMFDHLPNSDIKLFFGQARSDNQTIIKIGEKLGFRKVGDIPKPIKSPDIAPMVLHVYNVPKK